MAADPSDAPRRLQPALKLVVLALMIAIVGLPINDLFSYSLLATVTVVVAVGRATSQRRLWAAAIVVVMAAITAKIVVDVPRIEEGHNVFLPGGDGNALVKGLPPVVYAAMAAEFDQAFPPDKRCDVKAPGCWLNNGRPERVYAFSFDGFFDKPAYSRRVTGIDFSDAEWQRLGFVNELGYNWNALSSDVSRGHRRRGITALLRPWNITMPYFVMYSFPAAFVGSQLCWQGKVLWEGADERFALEQHGAWACRPIVPGDVGKRIFGLAISPQSPLAMTLRPTVTAQIRQLVAPATALAALVALLLLLLRWNPRRLLLPATFVALSLIVIVASDATLMGGLRPFDNGNDGLVYDGWSRMMAQRLLAGDVMGALEGLEPVFAFTPGSRYVRMVEHLFVGETYFGYVSLLLLLPFLVFCLFRRHFGARTALAMALMFIALPIGALFGSTFYIYVKHAAHGFGDSAAAILFLAGIVLLIGRRRGPSERFVPAWGAGLLFAIAVFVRPNLAIGAAVLLGGAGLAALWHRQFRRLAGMCIGFVPVFGGALHNWYFGGELVLFSSHTGLARSQPMPPQAYLSALWELLHLDFSGGDFLRGALQIVRMMVGPSESIAMVPVHAAAFVIVIRVLLARRYDGWLRLMAAAALGIYAPALFFIYSDRYQIVAWLLTLLICSVWARDEGIPWLERRVPHLIGGVKRHSAVAWLTQRLDGLARVAGIVPAHPRREL